LIAVGDCSNQILKKSFLTGCAALCTGLASLQVQAGSYIWDNQNNNGIWNDPVNWGILNNPGYNVAPVAGDTVIFRSSSPAGTITLTNHGFCARFRQQVDAVARTITIHPGQTVDRVLTLDGTAAELFDFISANTSFTLDGTPNGNGAKLRMVINGTLSSCKVNEGATLTVNCNVSGVNGITLDAGEDGGGTLVLGGVNSYTGPTTVNAGLLKLNGQSGAGAVTVNGGALWGQGTIAGPVTVAGGAKIAAGFSAGQLTLTAGLNLSAANDPIVVWELAAFQDDATGVAGTDFDQIVLTGGTLALGTDAVLDIRFIGPITPPGAGDPFWQSPHSWTLIRLQGGTNPGSSPDGPPSNFGTLKNARSCAGTFTTAATTNGIVLTFTPLPQPTPPRIRAIASAGAGNMTVNYTNTLPGTNYVLSCTTNLTTTNWFTVGNKTAGGASDFQTDNAATNSQRYYRVHRVEPLTLNVMTYNIQAARHNALQQTVLQELENIAQVIERNLPDVLMLQEVMRFDPYVNHVDEFAWLQQRLGYPHGYFASGQQDPVPPGTAEWGVAIYLRNGQIVSTQKHRLGYGRALLRVTAAIGGTNVAFYCTHLGSGAIAEQAVLVGEILDDHTPVQPIILGADFNVTPQAAELAPIRAVLTSVFEGFEEQPIDSFFVSGDVGVVCAQSVPDPGEASDHDPVITLLKIPLHQ
jgi:autotransporter-associated beta strand protein